MEDKEKFNIWKSAGVAVATGFLGALPILGYFGMKNNEQKPKPDVRGSPVVRVEREVEDVPKKKDRAYVENSAPVSQTRLEESLEKVVSEPTLTRPVENHISYKTDRADFSDDSDSVLLARMLYGEARSCSDDERVAVAHSAINRIYDGKKWNGENLRGVVLKPWQYSCFNKNDPNRKKLMDPEEYSPKAWKECLDIAEGVLNGRFPDSTGGATHYHSDAVSPYWEDHPQMKKIGKMTKGGHIFYIEN